MMTTMTEAALAALEARLDRCIIGWASTGSTRVSDGGASQVWHDGTRTDTDATD
ncbi:MAG: hypothetical protein RMJ48_12425 [Roseiflexaceae bacterium]|nr:hypothetical protein [Roseiflexaceae bacterium]